MDRLEAVSLVDGWLFLRHWTIQDWTFDWTSLNITDAILHPQAICIMSNCMQHRAYFKLRMFRSLETCPIYITALMKHPRSNPKSNPNPCKIVKQGWLLNTVHSLQTMEFFKKLIWLVMYIHAQYMNNEARVVMMFLCQAWRGAKYLDM